MVLKLLPKAASSRWLPVVRSAIGATSDAIDVDSFVDIMMCVWYELHCDRVKIMLQCMALANRNAGKSVTLEGPQSLPCFQCMLKQHLHSFSAMLLLFVLFPHAGFVEVMRSLRKDVPDSLALQCVRCTCVFGIDPHVL